MSVSGTVSSCSALGYSDGNLQNLLSKLQIQLADWEGCPSHVTPQGKAKIQTLTQEVSSVENQINASGKVQSRQSQDQISTNGASTTSVSSSALNTIGQTIGALINVTA